MDFSPEQYDAVIKKIQDGMDQAASSANDAIDRIIAKITGDIGPWLDKFREQFGKLVDAVEEFFKWVTVPPKMWEWGRVWLDLARQAGEAATELKDLDRYKDEWKGIAGGAYADGVASQRPAVDTIQARCNQISGACTGTAQAGIQFFMAVAVAIAGLIIALVNAADMIGMLIGIAVCLFGVHQATVALTSGVEGNARVFAQANEPTDGLPGGRWPQAVAS